MATVGILVVSLFIAVVGIHATELIGKRCENSLCLFVYSSDVGVTWQQSHDACVSRGQELVRITTADIQASMAKLPISFSFIWTAGRGSSDETWRYQEGTAFPDDVIGTGYEYDNCVYASIDDTGVTYTAVTCVYTMTHRLLCEYDPSPPDACDTEWLGNCYKLTDYGESKKIGWFDAQNYCSENYRNGRIASSNLNAIRSTITSLIGGGTGPIQMWVGVSRKQWTWWTGAGRPTDTGTKKIPMTYYNFVQPSGRRSSSSVCLVVFHNTGDRWGLNPCTDSSKYFICMSDMPITTTPAPTTTTTTSTTTTTTTTTESPEIQTIRRTTARGASSVDTSAASASVTVHVSLSVAGAVLTLVLNLGVAI